MNAMTPAEAAATALAEAPPVSEAGSLLAVISQAATNPAIDVDKLKGLMDLYERITDRSARGAYFAALAEMQPELPVIDENGGIKNNAGVVQSTYAKWEDINDAIRPILHKHGFGLSFRPGRDPQGLVTVTGVLSHRQGHSEEATFTLPVDSSGNKNSVQALGSSMSYGQRYTAKALLNITSRHRDDRDDNGQSAGLSEVAQRAISDINLAEGADELRAWKTKHYDGVSKIVNAVELRQIIDLYNRRLRAAKQAAPAQGGTQ